MRGKTEFEVEIPARKTRIKKVVKVPTSSSSEEKSTLTLTYHLTRDRVRGENCPTLETPLC